MTWLWITLGVIIIILIIYIAIKYRWLQGFLDFISDIFWD